MQPIQLSFRCRRVQRRGGVDGQERAAVFQSRCGRGGPTSSAVDERAARRRHRRHVRHPRQLGGVAVQFVGVTPAMSGITTVTSVSGLTAKSERSSSPTWRADAEDGSTRSSGKPHLTPRNGAPSTSSSAMIASPTGIGAAHHGFRPAVPEGLLDRPRTGSGRPSSRRPKRRTSSASSRSPSSTIAAGVTTIAATAANATTATPA